MMAYMCVITVQIDILNLIELYFFFCKHYYAAAVLHLYMCSCIGMHWMTIILCFHVLHFFMTSQKYFIYDVRCCFFTSFFSCCFSMFYHLWRQARFLYLILFLLFFNVLSFMTSDAVSLPHSFLVVFQCFLSFLIYNTVR